MHLVTTLGKWPTRRTILFYIFTSMLYMFRTTSCSSSGESIVSIQHLVYVTLCVGDRFVCRSVPTCTRNGHRHYVTFGHSCFKQGSLHDFGFFPRYKWGLGSSVMLSRRRLIVTYRRFGTTCRLLGLLDPWSWARISCLETSANDCQLRHLTP
jgi:hypothetical protein